MVDDHFPRIEIANCGLCQEVTFWVPKSGWLNTYTACPFHPRSPGSYLLLKPTARDRPMIGEIPHFGASVESPPNVWCKNTYFPAISFYMRYNCGSVHFLVQNRKHLFQIWSCLKKNIIMFPMFRHTQGLHIVD
jgi:hypothetical protein